MMNEFTGARYVEWYGVTALSPEAVVLSTFVQVTIAYDQPHGEARGGSDC
jgi:hypothetical protein